MRFNRQASFLRKFHIFLYFYDQRPSFLLQLQSYEVRENERFYFLYLHLLQTRVVNEFGKINIEFHLNKIMLIERW